MKLIIILLLILLITDTSPGQTSLHFNHLTAEQGLNSSLTKCIMKDGRGFLWIGTNAGISRFDGKNVISFSHIIDDTTSLINNAVNTMFEDKLKRIWVGTDGGLSILEPESSTFINYSKLDYGKTQIDFSRGVRAIGQFRNKIWIATRYFLISTPVDTIHFEVVIDYLNPPVNGKIFFLPNQTATSISALWFLTSKGPIYSEDGAKFYQKSNYTRHPDLFNKGFISTIVADGDSIIYFTTFNYHGVYIYQTDKQLLDSIPIANEIANQYVSIYSLFKSNNGEIWGTDYDQGIFRIILNSRTTQYYKHNESNPGSLITDRAEQILVDSQGTIFVATELGLDYANPIRPPFAIVNTSNTDFNWLDAIVTEDDNGILWLATFTNGLFSYSPETGKFQQFQFPGGYNKVWTAWYENNNLLLGTEGGLATFNTDTKKFTPLSKKLPNYLSEIIQTPSIFLIKDKNGAFWLGLYQAGIIKFDFKTGEYIQYTVDSSKYKLPTHGEITTADLDENGTLWVGFDNNNLSAINTNDNSIQNFKLKSKTYSEPIGGISSIIHDKKGNLWIGTSQFGLFKYNIAAQTFKLYDHRNGLPSNMLGLMTFDRDSNLWINNFKGIIKFDPENENFILYNTSDGLPVNEFDHATIFTNKDGDIYTGSNKYLISFNPDAIRSNPNLPKVILSGYKKSGQSLTIGSTDSQLNFTFRDKITFDFLGINFIDPDKTIYAYLLDKYDDDWNYSGNVSSANYAALTPGDYLLRVKATNKADLWNVPEIAMNIHVTGPLWKRWWFIASAIIFCFLITYAVYHFRLAQFKRIQEIRNKISKDLHDDIGSTLSSISISSSVAEKMTKDQYPEIISTMSYITENSRAAMENMSDIVWAINPSNDSFRKLIERLQIYAYKILGAKNIHFDMEIPETIYATKLTMHQRKNIYLILREAIQNVAKYSEATTCLVTGNIINKKINLQIKDDGLGFDEGMKNLGGNGIINMRQRADELNATFNIQSEKQKGTNLTLQFNHA